MARPGGLAAWRRGCYILRSILHPGAPARPFRRAGPSRRPLKATLGRTAWRNSPTTRSEEHTSELQSLMRISYAVFCLKTKTNHTQKINSMTHASNQEHTPKHKY